MRHSRALFGEPDSLDRDGAANRWVFGAVNDTHAAAAQFAEDFIPAGFDGCDHLPIPKERTQNGLQCHFAPFLTEVNGTLNECFAVVMGGLAAVRPCEFSLSRPIPDKAENRK